MFDGSLISKVNWTKYKPGLAKRWHYLLCGVMWSFVGILLKSYSYRWLVAIDSLFVWIYLLAGLILALMIYAVGFSRLAETNIHRIQEMRSDKPCIFAFQKWTSYPLVVFMISLGIFLRKVSPIPKPMLAVMYTGIGLGLFFSSVHYYRKMVSERKGKGNRGCTKLL